jgi:DNA (cytosine-5)-methyltransferase 3A
MNVLSLFDGISCGQLALDKAGIKYSKYYASEINKQAIKVTTKHYPKTIQLGDVTKIKTIPDRIDLLMGGSPCQGFSTSGKGLNFNDPKSKLFFEFVRLLRECRSRCFLLDNVPLEQELQDIITDHLKIEPITINSKDFSAQDRKRLYWTNIDVGPIPSNTDTTESILMDKVGDQYYLPMLHQAVILDAETKAGKIDKIYHTTRVYYKIHGLEIDLVSNTKTGPWAMPCLTANRRFKRQHGLRFRPPLSKFYTLVTKDVHGVLTNGFIRKLAPVEYERLQNVPDNYTDCISDNQRYIALGNCWTVDVIAHILKGL